MYIRILTGNGLTWSTYYCILNKGIMVRFSPMFLFYFLPPNFHINQVARIYRMPQKQRHPLQAMGLMSAILSQLVGSTLIGVFTGRWLDRFFHTTPLFLIVGLLLGLALGVYAMLRLVHHFFSGD